MDTQIKSFFLVSGIITLAIIISAILFNNEVKTNGVWVIAKIKHTSEVENGYVIDYEYFFENKKFTSYFKSMGSLKDSFILIKVSIKKPGTSKFERRAVPLCLKNIDSMKTYWKSFPLCK